jgi:hypothetical protein
MSKRIKIIQDDKNFNKHTEEGMQLLKHSVKEVGVIESITVDSDGKIITGNAREETFSEVLGDVEPIVVETDGTQPVVIKRMDIQSGTEKFYKAAILANTVEKKNINLDIEGIKSVVVDEYGIDMQDIGIDYVEVDNIVKDAENAIKKINTNPYVRTHILISFPPERIIEIQKHLEKIKQNKFVEYEQASN